MDQSIRVSVEMSKLANYRFVNLEDYDGDRQQYVAGLPDDMIVRANIIVGKQFRTFRNYFMANCAYVEELHQRLCRKGPHQFRIELTREDGTTITITSWGEFCREVFGCHPITVYKLLKEIQQPEPEDELPDTPSEKDEDQEEETNENEAPVSAPPEPAEMLELRQDLHVTKATAKTLEQDVKWYREMLLETLQAIEKLGGDRVPLKLHEFVKQIKAKLTEHERDVQEAYDHIEEAKQQKLLLDKIDELDCLVSHGKSSAAASAVVQ